MNVPTMCAPVFIRLFFLALWGCILPISHAAFANEPVSVAYNTRSAPVSYGVTQLKEAFAHHHQAVVTHDWEQNPPLADIIVLTSPHAPASYTDLLNTHTNALQAEGFQYRWVQNGQTLVVVAPDEVGAMYGLLELAEVVQTTGDYRQVQDKLSNPHFAYRIIKFNLPWSPYRSSPATDIHLTTCRDLDFWEAFLDRMAENRFNVLSLWNNHPFPYMIRAENFPKATPFTDAEIEDWQHFWKALFQMAKNRGIQTFIVNWNIVVSPEFAEAYGAEEYNDKSELVKKYTRESVTQLINEYDDLTGIGVTLADWMNNFQGAMSPKEREDWIEDTFVAGMKAADRKVKFLHRSVLSGSAAEMRRVINHAGLDEPALVEVKFNWSHGHSTPNLGLTHAANSGQIDRGFWDPKPENFNIQWMIRNEDFFILRWGDPEFIRQHIATNDYDYVNGYFIGSEGYIPAVDYSHKVHPHKTWQYAFEKQWLFYKLWGRLLYDPQTPDAVFEIAFSIRYGEGTGEKLLKAYHLASQMPLRLASFHKATWDYTLYSEGFLAPRASPFGLHDEVSPFISIDEFIQHETLEPSYLSIPDYVKATIHQELISEEQVTPLALAEASENDSKAALALIDAMQQQTNQYTGTLVSELDDVAVWSYLGLYFANKLRAGVALEMFRKTGDASQQQQAISWLEEGLKNWDKVIEYTQDRYRPVPHVSIALEGNDAIPGYTAFSWQFFRPQVERDIQMAKEAAVQAK